jgi:hypothetical protein
MSLLMLLFAREDRVVATLEGKAYAKGAAILTGVRGEQWSVNEETLKRTYEPIGQPKVAKTERIPRNPFQYTLCVLTPPVAVRTAWGSTSQGKAGDWLLQYGTNSMALSKPVSLPKLINNR